MNKKGEITTGVILGGFLGILVALILYQGTFGFISTATDPVNGVNRTYTMPAAGSSIDLFGQELLNTPVVTNATGGAVVAATNYTIAERVSPVDGLKRVALTSLGGPYASRSVNISYQFGQEGYIEDAGGRSVAGLITIMAAMAILVFAIGMVLKEKFF